MAEETVTTSETPNVKPMTESDAQTSAIFHVSVRAWLALILCGTVCWMSIMGQKVDEPLYTLAIAAASFYLGQKGTKP